MKWNSQKLKRKISKTIDQNLCPCPCFKNASLFIHRKKHSWVYECNIVEFCSVVGAESILETCVECSVKCLSVQYYFENDTEDCIVTACTLYFKIPNKNVYIILSSYR